MRGAEHLSTEIFDTPVTASDKLTAHNKYFVLEKPLFELDFGVASRWGLSSIGHVIALWRGPCRQPQNPTPDILGTSDVLSVYSFNATATKHLVHHKTGPNNVYKSITIY